MAKAELIKKFPARVVKFEVKACPVTPQNPTGKYIALIYCDNTIDPFEATANDNKGKTLFPSAEGIAAAEALIAANQNMPDRKVEKYRVTGLPGFVAIHQEDRTLKDGRVVKKGEPATWPSGELKVRNEMLIDIFVGGATQESAVDVAMRIINDATRFQIVGKAEDDDSAE